MEEIVDAILNTDYSSSTKSSLSSYQALYQFLENHSKAIFRAGRSEELDVYLSRLSPMKHTLGYMYMIMARDGSLVDPELFLAEVESIIRDGDRDQCSVALSTYCAMCQQYAEIIRDKVGDFDRGLDYLFKAIEKTSLPQNEVTPIQLNILMLALKSVNYRIGQRIASVSVFAYSKLSGLTTSDILRYHLYAGLTFLGLRRFSEALAQFEIAVTTSTMGLSLITIDAFKKFVLTKFLLTGKLEYPVIPDRKLKALQSVSFEYVDILSAAVKYQNDEIRQILKEYHDVYEKDRNLGLLRLALASIPEHRIVKLTRTYLTISLDEIVSCIQAQDRKEVELLLVAMISSGKLHAKIDQYQGIVIFSDESDLGKRLSMNRDLNVLSSIHSGIRSTENMILELKRQHRLIQMENSKRDEKNPEKISNSGYANLGGFVMNSDDEFD